MQDIVDASRVLSDIEIIKMITAELMKPLVNPLTVKKVTTVYVNFLTENCSVSIKEKYCR